MSDNTQTDLATSAGDLIADEDIAGVKYQRVKLIDATLGSTEPVGTAANPLHVTAPSAGLTDAELRATPLALPAGASTEATLAALKTAVDTLSAKVTACNTGAVTLDAATLSALESVTAVISGAVPLPAGAATEATLAAVSAKLPALANGRVQVELPAGGGGLTDGELRATPIDTQPSAFSFLERLALRALAKLTFTLTGARVDCGGSSVAVSSLPTLAAVTTLTTLTTLAGVGNNTQNGQAIQQSQLTVQCGFRRNIS